MCLMLAINGRETEVGRRERLLRWYMKSYENQRRTKIVLRIRSSVAQKGNKKEREKNRRDLKAAN